MVHRGKKAANKGAKQGLINEPAAISNQPEQDESCKGEQGRMSEARSEVTDKDNKALQNDKEQSDGSGEEKDGAITTHKKKKKNGIVADMDGDTLCGNSIPEQSVSEPISDSDTMASLPFTSLTSPASRETLALPGCFPSDEPKLAVPTTSDTNKPQQSIEANLEALHASCTPCSVTTAATQARITELEAEREPLTAELDRLDDGTSEANVRLPAQKRKGNKKKRRAGKGKAKSGYSAEDAALAKVAQLREQIRVLDERIAASKREQQAGELRCRIRRYESCIHEQSARWLHIDPDSVDVPVEFEEHAEMMAVLRAEVKTFEREVAKLENGRADEEDSSIWKTVSEWCMDLYETLRTLLAPPPPEKVYDWQCPRGQTFPERLMEAYTALSTLWALGPQNTPEGGCPCGQPVSGRLMNLFMVLLILWVLHSWFSY